MEKTRELPEKNEEMVTISKAEYEEMQAKIQWLMEQLRLNRKKQYGLSPSRQNRQEKG